MTWVSGARTSTERGNPKLTPSLGEEHLRDTMEEPSEGDPLSCMTDHGDAVGKQKSLWDELLGVDMVGLRPDPGHLSSWAKGHDDEHRSVAHGGEQCLEEGWRSVEHSPSEI
jgi:hypothetical protein